MNYPSSPGYARHSETSREAAAKLTGQSEVALAVLAALRSSGTNGLIVDEAKIMVERSLERDFDRSTVAARFTELKLQGMIQETEERRKTPRDRMASVFKITIKGRDFLLNRQ